MKLFKYLLTIILLCASSTLNAQLLKNTSLNLNAGGIIHDVAYDSYYNAFIVVGNFTTINGVARKNLAFIKATDFTVMSQAPITSIDDEIRTVEIRNNYAVSSPTLGNGNLHRIFIGGTFNVVNGQDRPSLAELTAAHYPSSQAAGTFANYNLTFWANNFYQYSGVVVNALALRNDTLYVGGLFEANTGNGVNNFNQNLITYDININSPGNGYFEVVNSHGPDLFDGPIFELEVFGNAVFAGGGGVGYTSRLKKFNFGGTVVPFTLSGTTGPVWDFAIHTNAVDTAVLIYYQFGGGDYNIKDRLNGSTDVSQGNWDGGLLDTYQNKVFGLNYYSPYQLTTRSRTGTTISAVSNTVSLNANWTTITPNERRPRSLFRKNNFLFVSGNSLTTIGGQPRTGLAVFCLEPMDAKNFTSSDVTICEGNVRTYTIPAAEYAQGYKWTYTGSGATYRIAGTNNALQPLTAVNISNTSANSLEIHFGAGTTSGTLTVEPYCNCNTTTDYMYAAGKSLTLSVTPVPSISMLDSMSFTCVADTLNLQMTSTASNVSYAWKYNNATVSATNSLQINKYTNTQGGYYIGTITEPINGCSVSDSIHILFDTIAAPLSNSAISTNPPIFYCSTNSMTLNGNVANASVYWTTTANPTNPLASPLTLYSTDTLDFILHATYASNGCKAQLNYGIAVDQTPLNGKLVGYPNFPMQTITDTINCSTPNIALTCDVVTAGAGSAQWLINSTLSGNLLNLSTLDTAGMDPIFHLKVYKFQTLNATNGCTKNYDVVIHFDLKKPFVATQADATLNCSQSNVTLSHLPTGGNVIEGWLDGTMTQTGLDTLKVATIGEYYYQVKSVNNGCVTTDTVMVSQTTELLLDLISDTLICPNQQVSLTVSPINNTETCSYNWSNGSQTQTTTATGGIDNALSVIVSNASGCIGYDTVNVLITPPILAQFDAVASCNTGSLQVASISGGSGNYSYSLDEQNWQTSTAFTQLSFGNYTIYVKDGLGCIYSFNKAIDGTELTPDINFLAPTYTKIGDTIALVNISSFTGFDSLVWTFPPAAQVLSVEDSLAILSINTSGWYEVVLTGYIDTCLYTFTKTCYFGTESPFYDPDNDSKGIDSLLVFPNPTSGMFTVKFTLGIQQHYTIMVTNLQGQAIAGMTYSDTGKTVSKDFSFPLGVPPGNYRIHIIADFDAAQQSIILSN